MEPWVLLIYRVPPEPASRRVTIWRQLKRMGGLYLQQCACLFPARPAVVRELEQRAAAIREQGGDYTLFDIPALRPGDEARIIATFRDLRNQEYREIIEECETKFVKEIEFEHFRQNYSYAETEEIRQDLEKIHRWLDRVTARDWFGADQREATEAWLLRCGDLLAEFEQEVYRRHPGDFSDEGGLELPAAVARGVADVPARRDDTPAADDTPADDDPPAADDVERDAAAAGAAAQEAKA